MRKFIYTFIFVLSLSVSSSAGGGGTDSPFSLGAGARELSLGGNSAGAISNSWTATFWNPSLLALTEKVEFGGFYTKLYDSDVSYQFIGFAYPTLDYGSFGLGLFRLGIDGIERRDGANLYTGNFSDTRLGVYLGYAKAWGEYQTGFSLYLEHHSLDSYSATSSPGLTLSTSRKWKLGDGFFEQLSSGVVVRNVLSPSINLSGDDFSYPLEGLLAVAIKVNPNSSTNHQVTLSSALKAVDGNTAKLSLGVEYTLANLIHLRGGYDDSRYSTGFGLSFRGFSFDYALVDRDLGSLHLFDLTRSFGSGRSEKLRSRTENQEKNFNNLMTNRMSQSNQEMLTSLVEHGKKLFEEGDLVRASEQFDRALFLARATGVDTVEISDLSKKSNNQLQEVYRLGRYSNYLDSAQINVIVEDWLSARYFAGLALKENANAADALSILELAEEQLLQESSREDLIKERLLVADSLVSYGKTEEAILVIKSLLELEPDDNTIKMALRRADFERLRAKASQEFSSEQYREANIDLDSALGYYPGHHWCMEMKGQVQERLRASQKAVARQKEKEKKVSLSPELKREVESAYRTAQKYFSDGDLQKAIENWERVERISPGYVSVREYLVNAYKFVGVEKYSLGELREAIDVWEKAYAINPQNREIRDYIDRTENEIKRLKELSYEP